jgi:hypothetical protein
MMFGSVPFRVSRLPSKTISLAFWTKSISQASSAAYAVKEVVVAKNMMANKALIIHSSLKFSIKPMGTPHISHPSSDKMAAGKAGSAHNI